MGKSKTIPLIVEEKVGYAYHFFGEWRKEYGKPSKDNLLAYRQKFMESCRKGGCNEHLGPRNTGNLRIRRQKDSAILAEYKAPLFEFVAV